MQFTFLGTAASEGYPNAFCGCANCESARHAGGPSLRKRSSALIDGELLLDLGPDLMAASMQHGVSLAKMRYGLQTHEHADHQDPSHLHSRSPQCGVHDAPRFHYYASHGALGRAARILHRKMPAAGLFDPTVSERMNFNAYAVEPFQHFDVGPYRIHSLQANHAPEITAMLYIIERGGCSIFYGTDTGEMPQETWDALQAYGKPLNMVARDHTFGYQGRANGHMNTAQFFEQVAGLRDIGSVTSAPRVFATHIAHHNNSIHLEMVTAAAQHGYEIAFGLTIDF